MTDSSLHLTPNAVPLDPAAPSSSALPPPSPATLTNGHITEDGDPGEGEDYTIKCICSFDDDDGNTVICDKCATWQHLVCYYPDGDTPGDEDSHFCIDCAPRNVDVRRAQEKQRSLRGTTPEEVQRKPKKPGPKPKKKKNDHLTHANGYANGHGSPRNGSEGQSKRPKARHQSSGSTTNIPLKLPGATNRRSTSASLHQSGAGNSPQSPSTSCDPDEAFSPEFLRLYDNENGSNRANVNEFEDITLTMTLGDWVRDEDILAQATNGKTKSNIFQRSHKPIQSDPFPLQIHTKIDKNITAHGRNPKWRFLTIEQDVGKSVFVGELHGKIGSMRQYTQDPANRWEYLRHPVPFVFFHPQLPIYIDTREEGSVLRNLRRSCNPNLTMKTVLEEEFDYHFVFSALRDIERGEELTIPWTLDEHTRRFFANQKDCDIDVDYVASYCRRVLAAFGGCACQETNCVMAGWAGWNEPVHSRTAKGRKKNGRGLGSRSGSEALRHYDEDLDDGTAASTSSHSKPHSRDITPSSTIDSKNILGEPISEREKRKIAALERSEQERLPEKKKQKRKSADNRANSHNPPPTPGFGKRGTYQDALTKDLGSPVNENGYRSAPRVTASPLQGSATPPPPKPVYRESSCQTEMPVTSPPPSLASPTSVLPRRAKNPLHRHVFRRSVLKTENSSAQVSPTTETKTEPVDGQHSPTASRQAEKSPAKDEQGDVAMEDAMPVKMSPSVIDFALAPKSPVVETKPDEKPQEPPRDTESAEEYSPPPAEPPMEESKPDGIPREEMHITNMPPPAVALKASKSVGTPTIVESPAAMSDTSSKALVTPAPPPADEKASENNKKKKISLKDWSRRSSSNVPKAGSDNTPQEGPGDTKGKLATLGEEAEKTAQGAAVETPSVDSGEAMVQS